MRKRLTVNEQEPVLSREGQRESADGGRADGTVLRSQAIGHVLLESFGITAMLIRLSLLTQGVSLLFSFVNFKEVL